MQMYFLILIFQLLGALADDPERELTNCEVCKFLAIELTDTLRDHNSTDKIQLSYNLDDMDKRTISYQTSETRLVEVLDSVCTRILEYNVHAERSGSNRYAKGRNRGVKVILDVPEDKWDYPSAEITNMEKSCNLMVEQYEEDIRDWYFNQNNDSLRKFLCEERVLVGGNQTCLDEMFVPKPKDESTDEEITANTTGEVSSKDNSSDVSGETVEENEHNEESEEEYEEEMGKHHPDEENLEDNKKDDIYKHNEL